LGSQVRDKENERKIRREKRWAKVGLGPKWKQNKREKYVGSGKGRAYINT